MSRSWDIAELSGDLKDLVSLPTSFEFETVEMLPSQHAAVNRGLALCIAQVAAKRTSREPCDTQ